MKAHDRDRALQLFQQASAYSNDLDPDTAARLQDHLSLLSVPRGGQLRPPGQPASPLDEAAAAQQALLKQVFADVNHREADARKMLEKDPKMALAMLQETRKKVESAGLEPAPRDQLLRRLDRAIADTQHYIEQNRSRIELDAEERRRPAGTDARSQRETANAAEAGRTGRPVQPPQRGAAFRGGRGHRQAGPGTRAPRAGHPGHGQQVGDPHANWTASGGSSERKEEHVANAFIDVDEASDPGNGRALRLARRQELEGHDQPAGNGGPWRLNRRHRSEKEIEIEKKLLTPVNYSCRNRPLSEVLNQLAKLVNVNIHLDDEGLREEGLSPDTPVTLELASDIQLKSYLNLILEKHHLCYIIKNEVLNITSETKKGDHVYQQVYPVGDLVMPIPNFVASPRMGLAGALHDAMSNAVGSGGGFGTTTTPLAWWPARTASQNSGHDQPGGDGQHGAAPARRQPAGGRRARAAPAAAPAPISTR